MGGTSKLSIEADLNDAERARGVMTEQVIPLRAWGLLAGGPLVASGANIVGFKATMTDAMAMIWDAGADASDIVTWDGGTDGHFRGIGGANPYPSVSDGPELKLLVLARKLDTTGSAADNTDLRLTADLKWFWSDPDEATGARTGNTALNALTTKATALLDVMAAAAVEEGYHWYELDLGARLEAETKVLKPYSYLKINLAVDDTVGTALNVEVISTLLRYRRHPALIPRTRRV